VPQQPWHCLTRPLGWFVTRGMLQNEDLKQLPHSTHQPLVGGTHIHYYCAQSSKWACTKPLGLKRAPCSMHRQPTLPVNEQPCCLDNTHTKWHSSAPGCVGRRAAERSCSSCSPHGPRNNHTKHYGRPCTGRSPCPNSSSSFQGGKEALSGSQRVLGRQGPDVIRFHLRTLEALGPIPPLAAPQHTDCELSHHTLLQQR